MTDFYEKQPIFVIANIRDKMFCPNNQCYGILPSQQKCCRQIDINNIPTKIWVTEAVSFYKTIDLKFLSLLLTKIYHSQIEYLVIYDQHLMFDEFKLLSSSAANVTLGNVKIMNADGSTDMLENIIDCLPNVKALNFTVDNNVTVTAETAKIIAALKNLGGLKQLFLFDIPETFNVEDFTKFIQDRPDVKLWLEFASNISEEYKTRLDVLVDAVLESGIANRYIDYEGLDFSKDVLMKHSCVWT